MADAMERVRAAEQRYNAVIERTATLDTHITAVDQHLTQLETEARATLAVLRAEGGIASRRGCGDPEGRGHRQRQSDSSAVAPVVLAGRGDGVVLWVPLPVFCGRGASG